VYIHTKYESTCRKGSGGSKQPKCISILNMSQLAGRAAEEASSEKLQVIALYKFEAKEKQPFPPDPHGWFSKTLNPKP
jgi:hypothetical protein